MIHNTLEDHLEELCPSCGLRHESKLDLIFDYMTCYISGNCINCNYSILKKVDFMTCGAFNYVDL